MNADIVWVACGLVLILEGLYPFVSPQGWRKLFVQLLQLQDSQIRTVGLISVVTGLLLLWSFGS